MKYNFFRRSQFYTCVSVISALLLLCMGSLAYGAGSTMNIKNEVQEKIQVTVTPLYNCVNAINPGTKTIGPGLSKIPITDYCKYRVKATASGNLGNSSVTCLESDTLRNITISQDQSSIMFRIQCLKN